MTTVMKDNQEGQPENMHLCTKGSSVYLGGDIRARQLEHSFGGRFTGPGLSISSCVYIKAQLT